ncbi:MFS transporter, partial [Nocardia carnea]|uniref:MFS transporter n=1 Tax=Nocardia carnea TaxID=37328 RepID=UPI002457BA4C
MRTDNSIVTTRPGGPRVHFAWIVAGVSFVAILGAAGFRAVPSVFMNPLHSEFGWSHATVGAAISVNMVLFGVTAPFAAALMDRFGVRPVLAGALVLIATGTGVGLFMTASWQLMLLWGVLVGLGTGSISMGFVATVSTRWFVAPPRRGTRGRAPAGAARPRGVQAVLGR